MVEPAAMGKAKVVIRSGSYLQSRDDLKLQNWMKLYEETIEKRSTELKIKQ